VIKHRDFIDLGFENETDMSRDYPTLVYRFTDPTTDLLFTIPAMENIWTIKDGRKGCIKTYCDAIIQGKSALKSLLNLYRGNLKRTVN